MDLNTVTGFLRPRTRGEIPAPAAGDAMLGGGTWLFSEPQTHVRRLIDLTALDWPDLVVSAEGLEIAATCTLGRLEQASLPDGWSAAAIAPDCCRALVGAFKVRNMATVGGNLCTALPAGPMIAFTAALDGICRLWSAEGGQRDLAVTDFVTGPMRTALRPGEVLRSIHLPARALRRRAAMRRAALTPLGRSASLLIATAPMEGPGFTLTVAAALPRPRLFHFPQMPEADALALHLQEALPLDAFFDDVHGTPFWRREMTLHLAQHLRRDLLGDPRRDLLGDPRREPAS